MSISPFSARPASPENERRRARLVLAIATVGIAATLLAYAISPGVRHAVGHAAHNVKRAVSHVLDRDQGERSKTSTTTSTQPASRRRGTGSGARFEPKRTTSGSSQSTAQSK
jgi:hypothetical protein